MPVVLLLAIATFPNCNGCLIRPFASLEKAGTGLERGALLSGCLWPNGARVKRAVSKIKLRSREFTMRSRSPWLETFTQYSGFCYLSVRGRKASAGASVVYRWRPKHRRRQHVGLELGNGRSRKDEGIGAAGWLRTGGEKLFWRRCQEVPTQVRRVNFKLWFFSLCLSIVWF